MNSLMTLVMTSLVLDLFHVFCTIFLLHTSWYVCLSLVMDTWHVFLTIPILHVSRYICLPLGMTSLVSDIGLVGTISLLLHVLTIALVMLLNMALHNCTDFLHVSLIPVCLPLVMASLVVGILHVFRSSSCTFPGTSACRWA